MVPWGTAVYSLSLAVWLFKQGTSFQLLSAFKIAGMNSKTAFQFYFPRYSIHLWNVYKNVLHIYVMSKSLIFFFNFKFLNKWLKKGENNPFKQETVLNSQQCMYELIGNLIMSCQIMGIIQRQTFFNYLFNHHSLLLIFPTHVPLIAMRAYCVCSMCHLIVIF